MATATKKAPVATSTVRAVRPVTGGAAVAFLTYQDNGDSYHWEIADGDGEALARSGSFASQDDAERAARRVREDIRATHPDGHVADGLRAVVV